MTTASERLGVALAHRYRIERELGAGGMATVYLAHDLKHDRKVALKVLKPELAAVLGAERFVVEIKTTASLQHPHILPLFDSGTADGFLYYVMPFIEGETLRDKLNRETQLGVDEAVAITRDVADALDYAHRRGVIHRDIKPENILLHDGRPMVADFGIALAVSAAAGGRMTETGLSLGTPHYMSPEQATADKDITGRSDVYSLASVLYEMLAGQPPHLGGSAQQIIMKIIAEPVDAVTRYRKSVPPNVAAALAKALEKLPADRFESAKSFKTALADPGFTHRATVAYSTTAPTAERESTMGRGLVIASLALAAIAIIAAVSSWTRPIDDLPVARFDLSITDFIPGVQGDLVISPDGSTLAVAGRVGTSQAIFVRRLDGETQFRMLPGTESGQLPSFSPDNRWIAFRREGALMKVPVSGGGVATLVPAGDSTMPAFSAWSDDGQVFYTGPRGSFRISANGGAPILMPKARARTLFPLPGGAGLLTTGPNGVSFYNVAADSSIELITGAQHSTYVETGHLLYVSEDNALFAVPFDLKKHAVTGSPVRVLDRLAPAQLARGYSVSRNGTLVVRAATGASAGGATVFVMASNKGVGDTLRLPRARRLLPRFSPDGSSIAYEQMRTGQTDIFVLNLVTGTNTQLTSAQDNDDPVWSPDGREILFAKGQFDRNEDLYVKSADATGQERELLAMPGNQNPTQWLSDGTVIFTSQVTPGSQADLQSIPASGSAQPRVYLSTPWAESDMMVSPDGRLAAYSSNESGGREIWIRDYPDPKGKWRVSTGDYSRWSRDGYLWFWRQGRPLDTLFRVKVDRTPDVAVRSPEVMLTVAAAGVANWDLHPDGRRFVVTLDDVPMGEVTASGSPEYLVVLNWFKELRATGSTR